MRSSSLTLLALISCSVILMVSVECKSLRTQALTSSKKNPHQNQHRAPSQAAIEFTVDASTNRATPSKFWSQDSTQSEIFNHLPDGQNRLLIFFIDNESYLLLWEQEGVNSQLKAAYVLRFEANQSSNKTLKYAVRVNDRNNLTTDYIRDHAQRITRSS